MLAVLASILPACFVANGRFEGVHFMCCDSGAEEKAKYWC